MLRQRDAFTFLVALSVWLALVLLAVTAILSLTAQAWAQQTSTASTLSAPSLSAQAGEGGVDLSWTEVSGAARYELWAWDSVNEWQQIGGDSLTGTSYAHTDVIAGTTYFYTVRAVNTDDEKSAWSDYVSAIAPVSASTLAVPALTAEATESGIELSWTAVTDAVRYELWVWDSVNGWQQVGGDSLTGTSYTHTDVTAGTTYFYSIRAVDAGGQSSPWSPNLSVTVPTQAQQQQAATATPTPTATPGSSGYETDRAALIALYNATDGPNWDDNANWNTSEPLDFWHGIDTDPDIDGRVTSLKQKNNGLRGTLPAALGNLSNLIYLNLWGNQLTGAIPSQIGNLSNLETLVLYRNTLSGQIPAALGNLASLEQLELYENRLSGQVPTALGNLSKLRTMNLSDNQLTGSVPTQLGNLSNLRSLNLSDNQLTGSIPSELGNLSLSSLYLSGNQFTGCIPAALRNVARSDLASLGLPYCATPLRQPHLHLRPRQHWQPHQRLHRQPRR